MTKTKNPTTLSTRRTSHYVRRVAVFSHRFDTQSALEEIRQINTRKRNLFKSVVSWWRLQDGKYRLKWRAANIGAVLVLLISIVTPYAVDLFPNKRYRLSQDAIGLVGKSNAALSSKLTYNPQTEAYEFNKEAVKEYDPVDALKQQVGGADSKTKSLYALDVPTDPKKGVTYYDVNSKLNFKLIPQFGSLHGKTEQGRIVYPLDGGPQAVYTLKNNGLKEDIVVTNNTEDTLSFTYKLELPKSLEAKQLPDGSGGIGLYAADPTLFSNMSYGSDKDRELVEKAREAAEKTNLVFGIPAPVITAQNKGNMGSAGARFELHGNQLTVISEHLRDIKGTFSIDPSVLVTSTTDFATGGNDEGNIDFGANQVNRGSLTGGTIGSWAGAANTGTTLFPATGFAETLAYGGYLYGFAGSISGGTGTNNVYYALICTGPSSNTPLGCDSNATAGKLGNWTSTTTLAGNQLDVTNVVAYNGFVYVMGGGNASNTSYANTYYAQICTGNNNGVNGCGSVAGALGTWNAGTNLSTATAASQAAAYNGNIYVMGGCTSGWISACVRSTAIQIASVNADGSLSAWTNNGGNLLAVGRHRGAAVTYNNRMYIIGGCTDNSYANCTSGAVRATDTQYTTINANGTLGATWTTSPNTFTGPSLETEAAIYKGYVYYFTYSGLGAGKTHSTQYAQINADGSIGPIRSTTVYSGTGRYSSGTLIANGYLYIIGGCTAGSCTATSNDVQYSKVDNPGTLGSTTGTTYNTGSNNTDNRSGAASVAYNGWLYVSGGDGLLTTVKRTSLNTNGLGDTNAAWGNAGVGGAVSNFNFGRMGHSMIAYNGNMYIIGGLRNNGASPLDCDSTAPNLVQFCEDVQYASINADGTLGAWHLTSDSTSTNDDGTVYSGRSFGSTDNLPNKTARGRSGIAAVADNGYLIVMGGLNNTSGSDYVVAEVNYALICTGTNTTSGCTSSSLPGTVGTWNMSNYSMNTQRDRLAAVAYGGYVYAFGGTSLPNVSGRTNTSEYTSVSNILNGSSPATWANACSGGCSDFTNTRVGLSAAVSNGYVYINGGAFNTGTNVYNDTQYAKIDPTTGSLVSWSTSPITFTGRTFHSSFIYKGYLYIVGGCSQTSTSLTTDPNPTNCTTYATTVQYAQINNGGSGADGTWVTGPTSGTLARYAPMAVASGGYMVVMGGCTTILVGNCTGIATGSTYASINANGSLGSWTAGTSLPSAQSLHSAGVTVANGYVYLVGGCSNGGCSSVQNTVSSALICTGNNSGVDGCSATGGTLGTWHTLNTISARWATATVAANGYLYTAGGIDSGGTSLNDVQSAQILPNGGLGSWGSVGSGATFSAGRGGHGLVNYGGYLYILGGTSGTIYSDVQVAQLQTNGQLGAWSTTTGMPATSFYGLAAASNGYMYYDGTRGSAYTNQLMYAPILPNGMLGNWTVTPGNSSTTALSGFAGAVYNGVMYRAGGFDGTSSLSSNSYYAPLQAQPRLATYSKLIDLGRSTNITGISYNGTASTVSFNYRVAGSNGVFGSTSSAGLLAPTGTCTGNAQTTRYIEVIANFDDSLMTTYGEASGSSITDFSVNFNYTHPPPNIRLRGGQTLQTGELSPFDTCGSMAP